MAPSITQTRFGTMPDGTPVDCFTLTNANGLVCKAVTYGATITELHVPGRDGTLGDIVLGFDNLGQYLKESPYFGCVVGRFANRIAHGRFTLEGKTYRLAINNPPNTLHGGLKGFDKAVWAAVAVETPEGPSIVFEHRSPDGDEGFPGALAVRMTYTLTHGNELRIDYRANTDRTTTVNLTNHSYFNLAGEGDILKHVLRLFAGSYTPVDDTLIPTGAIAPVAAGPLDFTEPKAIGRDIGKVAGGTNGYDHNFVIDGGGKGLAPAARVHDPRSGRTLEVITDEPGMQLYTSNGFNGTLIGKRGAAIPLHGAFCLETQHFPDSVNKAFFPTTLLKPGETFRSTTIHRFTAE
jgi:aldose 1-epimerase